MFQVCFTACFAEEGKESRKEYSIYYYARANARASVPCRKSVQKQESRRFSISGKGRKRGKSAGMAGKNTTGGIRKMQKIPEKIGMTGKKYGRRLHKTDRKKCSGNRKIPEWLIKKRQAASVKRKRFRRKIGMTEEKHGKSLHKTDKKMLRKPKNTGMTNKNTANSIHKTQKIPEKNRDDGEKTRRAPAQNKQKKSSGNPKYRYGWKKNGRQHP